MTKLNNNEYISVIGGADPCSFNPPGGFIRNLDYLIGYTFTKIRVSLTY